MRKLLKFIKEKIKESPNTYISENRLDFYKVLKEISKYNSQDESVLEIIKEIISTTRKQLKDIPKPFKASGNILDGSILIKYNITNEKRIYELIKYLNVLKEIQKLVEEFLEEQKLEETITKIRGNKEKKKKNIRIEYYDFNEKKYIKTEKEIYFTNQRLKFYKEMQNLGITFAKYPNDKIDLIFKKNKKKIDKNNRDKLAKAINKDETNFYQFKYDLLKFIENELILQGKIENNKI